MAYIPPNIGQNVMASSMGVVIASNQSPVSVAGTVIATPTGNQSVSGTVGASVIGHAPVVIVGGSILTSSTANQSVSGTVGASIIGTVPVTQSTPEWTVKSSLAGGIFPISGSVAAFVTNTNVNVSGSVAAWLQSTNASVITIGTPVANQSVSGTVGASIIGTVPVTQVGQVTVVSSIAGGIFPISGSVAAFVTNTNVNVSGSVAAWLQSTNASVITVGSPVANQSVSGTVNVGNFPTNQNISGSVVGFQGTSPWIITGSVQASLTPAANQSVSGTVGASVIGHAPVVIVGGSIAASFTPPANQSVSGTVGASVIGTVPVTQSGTLITSVVGAYPEDTAHTAGDIGLAAYGVRNDAVASFVSANIEYTPIATDSAGRPLIRPFAAEEARIEGYQSVVSGSVTTLVAAAGAGLRNYVTDVMIANTGASTTLVTFRDGAGSVLGYTIAPAGGGSNMIGMQTPIRTGVNATFDFQATTSTSILFATVKGFKAP